MRGHVNDKFPGAGHALFNFFQTSLPFVTAAYTKAYLFLFLLFHIGE